MSLAGKISVTEFGFAPESGQRRLAKCIRRWLSAFRLPPSAFTISLKINHTLEGKTRMPLLVVGSVALDSVETPTERRNNVLGGAAVFFSYSASYFSPVKLVGIVGDDWPQEHTRAAAKLAASTRPGCTW